MSSFSFNVNANLSSLEADLKKLFNRYATFNSGFNSNAIRNINNVVNNVNQGFSQAGQNFIANIKQANKESRLLIGGLLNGTAKVAKGAEQIVKISRNIQGFGDPKNLAGAFDGIGESLKSLGKGAKQFSNLLRASAAQSTGMKKGILSMASKGTAALGPMLSVVGSLAGVFATVIAVMIDAEAQAKGMNKAFLESGTSVADLGGSISNVKGQLKEARDAAMSWNTMMNFGASIEQQQTLINTLNKTGVTLQFLSKSAGGAAVKAASFQDVMKVAIVYAKNAGVSMEEVASHQGYLMSELGQSLKTVEQGFTSLYQASMSAGFGTARFFSMVQQATSGLAMYNVRTEQTAGLMVMLSKVLSPESAGRFLQSLTKGFGELNYQERFKKIKIAGEGVTKKIFEVEAKKAGQSFLDNFGAKSKDEKYTDAVKATVGIDLGQDSAKLVEQLSKLSDKQAAEKVAKARLVDPTGALSKELAKMIELAKGTNGSMDEMTKGLDQLGPGGVLAMQMAQNIGGVLKPFHERGIEELMATESFAGYSGEQLLEMRRISQTLYGNYDEAKKMAERMGTMDKGSKEFKEENKKMAESFGLALDSTGKLVQAAVTKDAATEEEIIALGTEVTDIQSYVVTQGDAFQNIATEETVDKQTALAMETAKNTTTMSDILEFGVKYFLEQIYGTLGGLSDIFIDLYNWVVSNLAENKGDKLVGKEQRGSLKEDVDSTIKKLNDTMSNRSKEMTQIERKIATSSGDERIKAKKELEALTKKQDQDKATAENLRKEGSKLSGPMKESEFAKIKDNIMSQKVVGMVGEETAAKLNNVKGVGSAEVAQATQEALEGGGGVVVGGVLSNASDKTTVNQMQAAADVKKEEVASIQQDQNQGYGMGVIDVLGKTITGDIGGAFNQMGSSIEEMNMTGGGSWFGKNMGGALGKEIGLEKEGLVLGEFAGAMTGGILDLTADLGGLFYENREEEKKRLEEEAALLQLEKDKKVNARAGLEEVFGSTKAKDALTYSERNVGGEVPSAITDLKSTVDSVIEGVKGPGGALETMGLSDASGNVTLGTGEKVSEDALMEQLRGQAFKHLQSVGAFSGDAEDASARIQEAMPLLIQGYLDQLMAQKAAAAIGGGATDFAMGATSFEGTPEDALYKAAEIKSKGEQDVKKALATAADKTAPGGEEFSAILNESTELSDEKLMAAEAANFEKLLAENKLLQADSIDKEKDQKSVQAKEIAKEMQKEANKAKIEEFFDTLEGAGIKDLKSIRKEALDKGSLRGMETKVMKKVAELPATNIPSVMKTINDISPATAGGIVEAAKRADAGSASNFEFRTPNDFIIAGNKYIEPSTKDTVIGFMPGGPVDQAINAKKGGMGGGNTIHININGGNQQEVYNTVMKVLTTLGIA